MKLTWYQWIGVALLAVAAFGASHDSGLLSAVGGSGVLCVILLLAAMVYFDRLRGKKPAFRLSNFDPLEGPGKFVVKGVNGSTRLDASRVYQADSGANARAKAELDGMVVTAVEREG